MIISQIAAMASNRVIGVNNGLPWSLPEDMKFFREKTKGHVLIMGRKTFESLGKPLPKRFHIVISRSAQTSSDSSVVFVKSVEEAIFAAKQQLLESSWPEEIFVIGGAEIYKQTLPYAHRIYLTVIEKEFSGDARFPDFSETEFKLVTKDPRAEPIPFSFRVYERSTN